MTGRKHLITGSRGTHIRQADLPGAELAALAAATGSGSVSSVGLALPSIFTVTFSPVTGSGTLTAALAAQVTKTFWAGPTSGADAAPTFRVLAAADLPTGIDATKIGAGGVTSTEFGYIGTLTSDAQTQLDAKQTLDADLTAIAALTSAANKLPYATGSGTWAMADFTPAGFTLTLSANASIGGTNTGDVANTALTTGTLAQFAATTSAQLAGVISDETGSGLLVFATNPVFTTPNIGAATGSVSGNAGTVTVGDAGGDTSTWVLLGTSQTGSLSPATDAGLTYDATANALTATTFIGALTGNASGSSGSCAGLAATATALATGRTIAMTGDVTWITGAFDGTANVTAAGTLATAQPAVHTWALAQTFTVAPVFTDQVGTRVALELHRRYAQVSMAPTGTGRIVVGFGSATTAAGTLTNVTNTEACWLNMQAAAGGQSGLNTAADFRPDHDSLGDFVARTGASVADVAIYVGFSASGTLNGAAGGAPNESHAVFWYDTATHGTAFWRVRSGTLTGTAQDTTTSIAVAASTTYQFLVRMTASQVQFWQRTGSTLTLIATHATTLPTSTTAHRGQISLDELGFVTKDLLFSRMSFMSGL